MEADLQYFTTAAISAITALSLYKVLNLSSVIGQRNKLIRRIENTPVKSADDSFVVGEKAIVKGTAARNTKDLRNDAIVKKSLTSKEEFIIHIKYREAIYSNESFTNKEEYVIRLGDILGRAEIAINPSFLLRGASKAVTLGNYDHTDYSPMLEIFKWDNKKRRLTISEKLQVLMLTYFRAIGTLVISDTSRPGYFRGLDVGTREVETGVRVGTSLMALGTIGLTMDGEVFLEPHLIFKDRLTMVANLKSLVVKDQSTRDVWTVVLILGAIYLGRRFFHYQKRTNLWARLKNWWGQHNTKGNKAVGDARV